jgi:hypothetical protein
MSFLSYLEIGSREWGSWYEVLMFFWAFSVFFREMFWVLVIVAFGECFF